MPITRAQISMGRDTGGKDYGLTICRPSISSEDQLIAMDRGLCLDESVQLVFNSMALLYPSGLTLETKPVYVNLFELVEREIERQGLVNVYKYPFGIDKDGNKNLERASWI